MLDNAQDIGMEPQQGVPETAAQASERLYKESEVNDIIGKKKHHAYQKGKADALAELQGQQTPDGAHGGIPQGASQEQIRQMIAEEQAKQQQLMQQHQHQQQLDMIHDDFYTRVGQGAAKYPDFKEVITPLLMSGKQVPPEIVLLANSVDNTADVIYDLAKNPQKIGNFLQLARDPSTQHLAAEAIQGLSKSIKQNELAQNTKNAPEPLSQLKPSYTGTDNGSYSVSDFKKMPWMKR